MLKLVLVSCGNTQRLEQYVKILKCEFSSFIKQHNFRFYDTEKISRAEADINLLNKNSNISFSTKKFVQKEYWGVNSDIDICDLYSRWCSSLGWGNMPSVKKPSYSRNHLISLVKKWLSYKYSQENCDDFDLRIEYNYQNLDKTKDLCIVEWELNQNIHCQNPIEEFKKIIVKLDELFNDVFLSAYITDKNENINDQFFDHTQFDYDLIESKVLDIGYAFYCNHSIENINNFHISEDLHQYDVNELLNGTLYVYEGRFEEYISSLKKIPFSAFDNIRMPKYRVFDWSNLCLRKNLIASADELISIYYDRYSPNDPVVIFSYGYDYSEVLKLPVLNYELCIDRFFVKEIL